MNESRLGKALAEIFGFTSFRPHQQEIVEAILARRDVFAVMPTGGGKSLCYQLPAAATGRLAIVVSPLISLMKDQVDAANSNGIMAATLNSSQNDEERSAALRAARSGKLRLLYISPERFNSGGFTDYLQSLPVSLFAVDEAHCISEWGHDFRPDYLSLSRLTREFPKIPVAAFTATATPRVAEDIANRLGLRQPHLVRASFNRPNLHYRVTPKIDLDRQILDFLEARGDEPGIIYRTTRKTVEATVSMLKKHGIQAKAYHAGLSDNERHSAQDAFRLDRCRVIVATIAFGMGIDKPNVRFVIHGDLPKNIEGYYQETGRAGRDGDPARCALFYGRGDVAQLARFASGIEDATAREVAELQLRRMFAFAQTDACRRATLLSYFGETYPEANCGACDVCLGEVEREDATISAQKALSAMTRTGGRFGATHLADILVGADTEKIRQNSHNTLPTFGVGKDRDKSYWRTVIDALVSQGLAAVEDQRYPTPSVTAEGWKVMKGETTFAMFKHIEPKTQGKTTRRTSGEDFLNCSKGLFARLKKERSRLAEERGIPSYVVFADKTLREMAAFFPATPSEMLGISGVGQHKLETYGELFLAVIAEYRSENPEEKPASPATGTTQPKRASAKPPPTAKSMDKASASELATWDALNRGLSIADIANQRQLKPETILTHMEHLAHCNYALAAKRFFAPERLEMILSLFRASGSNLLTPVVEASEGKVDFLEARLARIFLRDEGKEG